MTEMTSDSTYLEPRWFSNILLCSHDENIIVLDITESHLKITLSSKYTYDHRMDLDFYCDHLTEIANFDF